MIDAVVDRVHRALVQALRGRGSEVPGQPVTVAEIYQDLIPYRSVRGMVGVELNADYEHALLRLLAGEGGRVKLEPASAREELREELESPNPNVGLFRKYAACDVWVSEPDGRARPPDATPSPEIDEDDSVPFSRAEVDSDSTLATGAGPAAGVEEASPALAAPQEAPSAAPVSPVARVSVDAVSDSCSFCHERLPVGRTARFCPHCGMDQQKRPCARCGEALDASWRFCIACGKPAREAQGTS